MTLLRLAPSAALLASLRAAGLRRIATLRLTRNRSVVVSFRGERLRVHESFLRAPAEVLRAIVVFVEGRHREARRAARRALLEFERRSNPAPSAPRVRIDRTHPDDRGHVARLVAAHRELNERHFEGALGPIAIAVSRRLRRRLAHYTAASAAHPPGIVLSRRHIRRDGWMAATATLLHEMVHQWQDESGLPVDHGREFRRKAREVGIDPRAASREPIADSGQPIAAVNSSP